MARDRDFLDAMRGLGVRPLSGPPLEPSTDAKRLKRPPRRPAGKEVDATDTVAPEDQALFAQAMDALGVAGVSRGEPAVTSPEPAGSNREAAARTELAEPALELARSDDRPEPVTAADRALFLAGVERVGPAADKDALAEAASRPDVSPADRQSRESSSERSKPRRTILPRRAPTEIDDRLDLHRERQEPALERLRAFLVQAAIAGHTRVLVITGKGHHSEAGRSILRQAVENWLIRHGGPWVARYAVAPRALGGRGAWILELHR